MRFDDKLFIVRCWYCIHSVFFTNLLSDLESLQATGENDDNQRDPTAHGALFTLQLNLSEGHRQVLSLRSQPLASELSREPALRPHKSLSLA